jgi:hypothetical protein
MEVYHCRAHGVRSSLKGHIGARLSYKMEIKKALEEKE